MSASDSLTVLVTHCGWLVGQQNCPQVLSQAGIAVDLSSSGLYVIGGGGGWRVGVVPQQRSCSGSLDVHLAAYGQIRAGSRSEAYIWLCLDGCHW